jgi:hypothetical protein
MDISGCNLSANDIFLKQAFDGPADIFIFTSFDVYQSVGKLNQEQLNPRFWI